MFSMVRVITQVISVTKCTTAQLSMFVKMHFLLSWHVMSPRRVFIRLLVFSHFCTQHCQCCPFSVACFQKAESPPSLICFVLYSTALNCAFIKSLLIMILSFQAGRSYKCFQYFQKEMHLEFFFLYVVR